jgi:hypothetical protein
MLAAERDVMNAVAACLASIDSRSADETPHLPACSQLAQLRLCVAEFTRLSRQRGDRLEHVVRALRNMIHLVRPAWAIDDMVRALTLGWCVESYHEPPA